MTRLIKGLKVSKYIFTAVIGFGLGLGLAVHYGLFAFAVVGIVGVLEMSHLIGIYEEV